MRTKIGDIVRLYGRPGTFEVVPYQGPANRFYDIAVARGGKYYFGTSDMAVVEINGQPVPCLSAPLGPPARDYPHLPQFDYSDGPPELGNSAIEWWRQNRAESVSAARD